MKRIQRNLHLIDKVSEYFPADEATLKGNIILFQSVILVYTCIHM